MGPLTTVIRMVRGRHRRRRRRWRRAEIAAAAATAAAAKDGQAEQGATPKQGGEHAFAHVTGAARTEGGVRCHARVRTLRRIGGGGSALYSIGRCCRRSSVACRWLALGTRKGPFRADQLRRPMIVKFKHFQQRHVAHQHEQVLAELLELRAVDSDQLAIDFDPDFAVRHCRKLHRMYSITDKLKLLGATLRIGNLDFDFHFLLYSKIK